MAAIRNIVILTGAGISAESGIDTFRGAGGLWENMRVEDVATLEAFARDPDLVLRFYDMRRAAIQRRRRTPPTARSPGWSGSGRSRCPAAVSRWSPRMSTTCICAPVPSA
jgi:hypothetical protein